MSAGLAPQSLEDKETVQVERGDLSQRSLALLLWNLEHDAATAIVRLERGKRTAHLFVERGRLVSLHNVDAAARELADLFVWPEATWEIEHGLRSSGPCMALPMSAVVPRATRYLENARLLLAGMPHPSSVLEPMGSDALIETLDGHQKKVFEGFDGERSLIGVLGLWPGQEQSSADAIRSLWSKELIREHDPRAILRPRNKPYVDEEPVELPEHGVGFKKLWTWFGGRSERPRTPKPPIPADFVMTVAAPRAPTLIPSVRVSGAVPWDRYRPAVAVSEAEIRHRLKAAFEAELETCPEASDRAFVERLLGYCRGSDLVDLSAGAHAPDATQFPGGQAPTFPITARMLLAAMRDQAPGVSEVAELVSTDHALSNRVMALANSPAFGRVVDGIEEAITRIGADKVFRLSLQEVLNLGEISIPLLRAESLSARRTALLVADVASSFARDEQRCDAFLSGLFHELGTLEIHRIACDGEAPDKARVRSIIDAYQTSIGALVVRRWQLGEAVAEAVARFAEAGSDEPYIGEIARFVRVAQIGVYSVLFRVDPDVSAQALSTIRGHWDLGSVTARARSAMTAATGARTVAGLGPVLR